MEGLSMIERDTSAFGNLFQLLVNEMKCSGSTWDDLAIKATKLHSQLKATIAASTAFLDLFQKIADIATSTRGGTKEIGSALTRLCLRQRSVEARLKTFTSSLMDCFVLPLQDRLEEWKRTTIQLDKERSKEIKRVRQEMKKRGPRDYDSATLKLQRKLRAAAGASGHLTSQSVQSLDGHEKLHRLEEIEKRSLRRILVEERSRFCLFVNFLRPVLDEEIAMLSEVNHLSEIMDHLSKLTCDPYILPPSSESVISDLTLRSSGSSLEFNSIPFKSFSQMNLCSSQSAHSPPSSPSSFGSRKSSLCSMSSYNSTLSVRDDSNSSCKPGYHRHRSHQPQGSARYRSLSQVSSYSEHSSSFGSVAAATPIVPTSADFDSGIYSRPHFINGPPSANHYHRPASSLYRVNSNATVCNIHETPPQQLNESSAYSEGSITPTNNDTRSVSPSASHSTYFYGSAATLTDTSFDTQSIHSNSNGNSNNVNNDNNHNINYGNHTSESCYSNVAPTVPLRNPALYSHLNSLTKGGDNETYASCGSLVRSGKKAPPPPLPARRTSTLTDPNAITLATLASTGCSSYGQVQNLQKISVSDASIYQSLSGDQTILSNLTQTPRSYVHDSSGGSRTAPSSQVASPIKPTSSVVNLTHVSTSSSSASIPYSQSHSVDLTQLQYQQDQRSTCERPYQQPAIYSNHRPKEQIVEDSTIESASSAVSHGINALIACPGSSNETIEDRNESSDTSILRPPPSPPEAVVNCKTTANFNRRTDVPNRLSNVSDHFLHSLNAKLAVSQQQRISPHSITRRSVSAGEHEFTGGSDTDSGIYLPGVSISTGGSSECNSAVSSINSTGSSLQQSFKRLMCAASSAPTSSTVTQPTFVSSLSNRLSHRFNPPDVTGRMSFSTSCGDSSNRVAETAASMASCIAKQFESRGEEQCSSPSSPIATNHYTTQQSSVRTSSHAAPAAKVTYSTVHSPPVKGSPVSPLMTAPSLSTVTSGANSTGPAITTVASSPSPSPSLQMISTCSTVNCGKRASLPSESRQLFYQSQGRHNSTGNVLSNVVETLESFDNSITSKVTSWFTGQETLMDQIRNGNHHLKKVPDPENRSHQ